MSQLIGLGGPQGPAGSSPQPTSWDKAEAQREPDVPSLTQQTVESQCGNAGLLTPRSVLPSIQVAQAMFPRALFPLSGVELLSAPHIHTLFPCSLAESPSLGGAGLKAECFREPRDTRPGLGCRRGRG